MLNKLMIEMIISFYLSSDISKYFRRGAIMTLKRRGCKKKKRLRNLYTFHR